LKWLLSRQEYQLHREREININVYNQQEKSKRKMKYLRFPLIVITIITLPLLLNSCGDGGVSETPKVTGLTVSGLPTLITTTDGYYEAWVSVEEAAGDHGDAAYRTLGKFNVRNDGVLIDPNGNNFSPDAGGIDLNKIEDALISIEPTGDADTILNGTKFLGAAKSVENGVLVFRLSMSYSHILGNIANNLPNATAKYILAAPTDTTNDPESYKRGVWFTIDTLGQAAGLTVGQISDTLDWKYQAWVFDGRDTVAWRYDMGKFNGPNDPDNFQQCQVVLPSWNKPGQDWTRPGCPGNGVPDITDLTTDNRYILVVTLEPKIETQGLGRPFQLVLFHGRIPAGTLYGEVKQINNTVKLPTAELRLSYQTK
jgi:hypothetical protein